ncbi:MAG: CD3324 family protein [Sarcina sp.]
MKYKKALDVLPTEIIKILQEYIDGEFLYIPKKENTHKAWGEKSGIKKTLMIRNNEIFQKYLNGTTVYNLAKEYYLSEKSIQRIIYNQKQQCS